MKQIKAVSPYIHSNYCNFKSYPFEEWEKQGLPIATPHYLWKCCNWFTYNHEIPSWFKSEKEARIRFVSGYTIKYDTFPDYAFYEIIPVIWDCWPKNVPSVTMFLKKHKVRTAIFTSSQTANIFKSIFPDLNVLAITEGANVDLYDKGKLLQERGIDILEIGRAWVDFFKSPLIEGINHIITGNMNRAFITDEDFRNALSNTKISINVPRCDVDKETAGNIETLTQRYWECMLSRVIMVGRAPTELTSLIGYNPVIEWDGCDASPCVNKILNNIEGFQALVDKNYETAVKYASWGLRINQIIHFLRDKGYHV